MFSYNRNELYITTKQQEVIKNFKVLLGGCGIGSNIAECALRLGFENITLVDGDFVEATNLNRQNYETVDIGLSKVEALKKRLSGINPVATITTENCFLDKNNLAGYLTNHKAAINALDFESVAPLVFDEECQNRNIPVIHPYNIGWATLVFVIQPQGPNLKDISADYENLDEKVVSFFSRRLKGSARRWISDILVAYQNKHEKSSPPQLSVGSWLAAGVSANLLFRLALGKPVKSFPDFYFSTIEE